jgi:hypothetical protein
MPAESNRYPPPHPSPKSTSDVSDLDQSSMAELGNTRVRLGEGAECGSPGTNESLDARETVPVRAWMQYSRASFCLNPTLLCLLGQDNGIVEFFPKR